MKPETYKLKIIHWNSGDAERAERGMREFLKRDKKNKLTNKTE